MLRLTLVGRSYCSLCDKMRDACRDAARRDGIELTLVQVDLDDHPALETKFGEWVPVLLNGPLETGIEVCHYHFDAAAWDDLRKSPMLAEAGDK